VLRLPWGHYLYLGYVGTSGEPHRSGLFRRRMVSGQIWNKAAGYAAYWSAVLAVAEPVRAFEIASSGRVKNSRDEVWADMKLRVEEYDRTRSGSESEFIVDDIANTFFREMLRGIPAKILASSLVEWKSSLLAFDAISWGLIRPGEILLDWTDHEKMAEVAAMVRKLYAQWSQEYR